MMADASLLKHLDGALILLDVKDAEIKELREAQDRTADELGQAIGSGEQLLARAEAAEANLARAREIMKPDRDIVALALVQAFADTAPPNPWDALDAQITWDDFDDEQQDRYRAVADRVIALFSSAAPLPPEQGDGNGG